MSAAPMPGRARTLADPTAGSTRDQLPRPRWLPPARWPHPILALDGASAGAGAGAIAYTDVGTGPTLLLVHTGFWSFVWRDLIERLQSSFRCVTLDAPGTGLSAGAASSATVAAAASAVDALVEHLGLDELVLVVHDLGGPVALQAASRWPERVSGLAGVNTFAWRPSGVAFRAMLAVMGSAPVRGLDAVTGALPRASATRVGVGRHLDRADRRSFLRGVDRRGRRSFHRYLRSVAGHDFAAIEATVERLAGRPAITVFGARNDPLGFQPMWADRFDDLVQVTVPGGNHFPMCDAPDQVAAALTGWQRERVSPT